MDQRETDIIKVIKERRSIREFESYPIPREMLASIMEAGRWAPSGLNNQPWRFVVVEDENIRLRLSDMTKYSSILLMAPVALVVFLDKDASYSRDKDILAIGACIQNMLLQTHSLGLGSCWLGEILRNSKDVESLLGVPDTYELLAVLAIGYPKAEKKGRHVSRKDMRELVFGSWPFY